MINQEKRTLIKIKNNTSNYGNSLNSMAQRPIGNVGKPALLRLHLESLKYQECL